MGYATNQHAHTTKSSHMLLARNLAASFSCIMFFFKKLGSSLGFLDDPLCFMGHSSCPFFIKVFPVVLGCGQPCALVLNIEQQVIFPMQMSLSDSELEKTYYEFSSARQKFKFVCVLVVCFVSLCFESSPAVFRISVCAFF